MDTISSSENFLKINIKNAYLRTIAESNAMGTNSVYKVFWFFCLFVLRQGFIM